MLERVVVVVDVDVVADDAWSRGELDESLVSATRDVVLRFVDLLRDAEALDEAEPEEVLDLCDNNDDDDEVVVVVVCFEVVDPATALLLLKNVVVDDDDDDAARDDDEPLEEPPPPPPAAPPSLPDESPVLLSFGASSTTNVCGKMPTLPFSSPFHQPLADFENTKHTHINTR